MTDAKRADLWRMLAALIAATSWLRSSPGLRPMWQWLAVGLVAYGATWAVDRGLRRWGA